ncbi:MAG: hydrogenase small subunit [Candidatus Omnitrophota bacterium]
MKGLIVLTQGENKGKMKFTRRQFLKIFSSSAAAAAITSSYNPVIVKALTGSGVDKPAVIWLQGAGCNGCSISLLNTVHPKIAEVLIQIINLEYHPTLMAGTGKTAFDHIQETAQKFKGKFILILEGGVPTAENGLYCTIGERNGQPITLVEAVQNLVPDAGVLMAVGTCAAFGGIPSAKPNPTQVKSLAEVSGKIDKPVINISGCPTHPDWVVGTIVHVLNFGIPELLKDGRPAMFYKENIHENCTNYSFFANAEFASEYGQPGCLAELGCKGPVAYADCSLRRWNNGVNWCIGSGTGCIACCEAEFPDNGVSLYAKLPKHKIPKAKT